MAKAIIDKKSNLARGFADLNTPSLVEKELLFSWQEKKQNLKVRIESLTKQALNERCISKRNILNSERVAAKKSLDALGIRINKRVNLHALIIDRFKQICTPELFHQITTLARRDKAEVLKSLHED
jgi:hypothetical protein